jgi:hypothetical protein
MAPPTSRKLVPLAKVWTWTGSAFLTLVIGWAFYVNGVGEPSPAAGLRISRAYAGLVVTLLAGSTLAWSFALYVSQAHARGLNIKIPPNTLFEDKTERNTIVSRATIIVFAVAILYSLILFTTRYSESRVYTWDGQVPLADSFFSSRAAAHAQPCPDQPCFAMARRAEGAGKSLHGVFEYIPYVTDGAIILLAITLLAGLGAVFKSLTRAPPTAHAKRP